MSATFDPVNSDGLARHLTRAASTDDPDAIFDAEAAAERAWVAEHREHGKEIVRRLLDERRARLSVV